MGTMGERAGTVSSRRRRIVLLAATALTVTVPSLAHAVPVPIYSNVVEAVDPYPYPGDTPYASQSTQQPTGGLAVTHSVDTVNGVESYTATTDNNYSVPSIYAAGRAVGSYEAEAGSSLIYYFEFSSTSLSSVLRRVEGTVSATIGETEAGAYPDEVPHNHSSASFNIDDQKGNGSLVSEAANASLVNNSLGETQETTFDQVVTFQTNLVYRIVMDASAIVAYDHVAAAFSDPYIDLSNLPDGVTFLESAGIGDSLPGATPLPAALPLFAGGLGAFGLLGWRRKRKAPAKMV